MSRHATPWGLEPAEPVSGEAGHHGSPRLESGRQIAILTSNYFAQLLTAHAPFSRGPLPWQVAGVTVCLESSVRHQCKEVTPMGESTPAAELQTPTGCAVHCPLVVGTAHPADLSKALAHRGRPLVCETAFGLGRLSGTVMKSPVSTALCQV
jgi:hypothetical protein